MATVTTGILDSIRTLKDKSVKITIELQELSPSELANLIQFNGQFVKLAISSENISHDAFDSLDDIPVEHEGKSPSLRLRNVLYRLWEQQPMGYDDFNLYYLWMMEKIILRIKEKLS